MATDTVDPYFLEIGQRLEMIREALDISAKNEFAALCGVQPNTYSQWISGRAKISLDLALQVAKATGATLDYIYLGKTDGLPMKFMRILQQGSSGGDPFDRPLGRKKAG